MPLSYFTKAEELLKNEKFYEAENQATIAFLFGFRAIIALSEELEMPGLSIMADNAGLDFFDRSEKHYTPKEKIEWYRSTLKRLSDELPLRIFSTVFYVSFTRRLSYSQSPAGI